MLREHDKQIFILDLDSPLVMLDKLEWMIDRFDCRWTDWSSEIDFLLLFLDLISCWINKYLFVQIIADMWAAGLLSPLTDTTTW